MAEPATADLPLTESERSWLARVGERLRLARLACRETQAELAARAGVARVTVGFIERGDRQAAALLTYRRLADALGLALDAVLAPGAVDEHVLSPVQGAIDPTPELKSSDFLRLVGEQVRHLRRQRDLTQAELATAAGIRRNFIYKLERGEHAMHVTRLYTLARALGVAPADLLKLQGVMTVHISKMTSYCPVVTTDDQATSFLRAFGARLRLERERRRLSQEDFAALIGFDPTFYGALERGDRGCNIGRLPAISRGLGLPMSELLPPEGPV